MAEVLVIQHAEVEPPGLIGEILQTRGHTLRILRPFAGEPVPESLREVAGLVLMGGPMGVYEQERYPFLRAEMRLIEEALRRDFPVLGVCLGSQLLAAVLGARVGPGPGPELGWHPVTLEEAATEDRLFAGLPSSFVAFHWHGDVFDLPAGATWLARSERTLYQAFRYGHRAYGLLFHLEATEATIRAMVRAFPEDLRRAGLDPEAMTSASERYLPALRDLGSQVFGRWAALLP
ncbi:MAG: type 1 glutamine amidotransferase [Armatimonadota bacterium]|nr:type 1 glutamine amidotransferase [Armatimonadota bacterium]MDR7444379.1 type 1 glutamine amidotransferase [Armatimonadota bacterium]MDR7570736.1 type 1 glutamine amidotransferase [Armatimonadota bacterium]MDR7614866.1 type 1 glutamine amidotransferase [Armatimonadota bacterium]